jgi:hypothetical protein
VYVKDSPQKDTVLNSLLAAIDEDFLHTKEVAELSVIKRMGQDLMSITAKYTDVCFVVKGSSPGDQNESNKGRNSHYTEQGFG